MIIGIFNPINVSIFGFEYYGTILHIFPLFACSLMTFTAVTAHFILWGKDLGVIFGIICGVLGLAVSLSALVYSIYNGHLNIRLEPLLQIPFIIVLFKKKKAWDAYKSTI